MKFIIAVCCLLLGSIAVADQQNLNGYLFSGVGGISGSLCPTMNLGAGVDYSVYKGFALTTELSYLGVITGPLEGLGVWNLNGSYYFPAEDWAPFVTGGYTIMFREGAERMFNVGGGFEHRLKSGKSLRLEFRDHVVTEYGTYHYYGFRVGWTF